VIVSSIAFDISNINGNILYAEIPPPPQVSDNDIRANYSRDHGRFVGPAAIVNDVSASNDDYEVSAGGPVYAELAPSARARSSQPRTQQYRQQPEAVPVYAAIDHRFFHQQFTTGS
jgi:hypothetical protein